LVNEFVKEFSLSTNIEPKKFSQEAIDILQNHDWPGNVRELKNWIERAVNITEGSLLVPADFPVEKQATEPLVKRPSLPDRGTSAPSHLCRVERDTIHQVLEACGGNMTETAKRLGIGRATLYRKLKKYGLSMARTVSF